MTFPPNKILVATDFSDHSQHALKWAVEMARGREDALVVVLHVAPDVPAIVTPLPETSARQAQWFANTLRERREQARSRMEKDLEGYYSQVEFELVFEEGAPAATIARVAKEKECGLVVVGLHGRTGLMRALLGSVAERTARLAEVPVLIVR